MNSLAAVAVSVYHIFGFLLSSMYSSSSSSFLFAHKIQTHINMSRTNSYSCPKYKL